MAEPISDRGMLAVLCPFVRATRPVLDALAKQDPFDLRSRVYRGEEQLNRTVRHRVLTALAEARVPGTPAWAEMSVEERCRWWVYRVGRFTTLLASVPGIWGALANRLPVQAAMGAAAQGLLLCAIAREHGVRDEDQVVAMLGAVMFKRDLGTAVTASTARAGAHVGGRPSSAEVEAKAAELTGELAAPGKRPSLRRIARAVWRLGRALLALEGELYRRPHARWYHRALGALPVVGMLGDYLGEWSGLKRASRRGIAWLRAHPGPGGS
jgi:hypothetical protein